MVPENSVQEWRAIQRLNERTSDEERISIQYPHQRTAQVANVSLCLTEHSTCTGLYVDFTGKYLIKCECFCHNSKETEVRSERSEKIGKVLDGFDSDHEKSVQEGNRSPGEPYGAYTTITPQAKWSIQL